MAQLNRCLVLVISIFCLTLAPQANAQLLLNEVHSAPLLDFDGDGVVDTKLDEWVELFNAGSTAISLDDCFLRDGNGDNYHYEFSGILEAGAHRVVFGSDATAWQASRGESTSGLSLNNSGDTLELWRDRASPRILEVVDFAVVPSHASQAGRSYGRLEGGGPWSLFDSASPYAGSALPTGNGCDPSPGQPNLCGTLPTESVSFGAVKALFP